MDLQLSKEERDLQSRARAFAEQYLFPHEIECDENEGLSKKSLAKIRKAVIDHGFNGFNHTTSFTLEQESRQFTDVRIIFSN